MDSALQDERGKELARVPDVKGLFEHQLPLPTDERFVCLRFIDPYQNTTFNQRQMIPLIRELELVRSNVGTAEEKDIFGQVLDLARKCAAEPHVYVKFIGD